MRFVIRTDSIVLTWLTFLRNFNWLLIISSLLLLVYIILLIVIAFSLSDCWKLSCWFRDFFKFYFFKLFLVLEMLVYVLLLLTLFFLRRKLFIWCIQIFNRYRLLLEQDNTFLILGILLLVRGSFAVRFVRFFTFDNRWYGCWCLLRGIHLILYRFIYWYLILTINKKRMKLLL